MSEREVHRVEVLSSVVTGGISTSEAASVLCLSDRQVQRLLKTIREDRAIALRHRARGRPSNNRTLEGLRDLTLSIVHERYADFGPTLAAEKLAERDGVKPWPSPERSRTPDLPRRSKSASSESATPPAGSKPPGPKGWAEKRANRRAT